MLHGGGSDICQAPCNSGLSNSSFEVDSGDSCRFHVTISPQDSPLCQNEVASLSAAESHNGHSGWHMVACYRIDRQTCHIKFVHIMGAVLNGHTHSTPDWTYVGSKVNVVTGS